MNSKMPERKVGIKAKKAETSVIEFTESQDRFKACSPPLLKFRPLVVENQDLLRPSFTVTAIMLACALINMRLRRKRGLEGKEIPYVILSHN